MRKIEETPLTLYVELSGFQACALIWFLDTTSFQAVFKMHLETQSFTCFLRHEKTAPWRLAQGNLSV